MALPGGLRGQSALGRERRGQGERFSAPWQLAVMWPRSVPQPEVLRRAGLLRGRRVTSFPGALAADDATYSYVDDPVVIDRPVTTSRGPDTAMDFRVVTGD